MHYLSEFIGVIIIILFGNGMGYFTASQKLKSRYWDIAAWGVGVFVAIIVALYMGGKAHLNPVVTLGSMFLGTISIGVGFEYILLQIAGAFVAQMILNIVFVNIFKKHPKIYYSNHATKQVSSLPKAFANEFIGTTILVLVAVVALNYLNTSETLHHLVVALVVGATVSFIGTFFSKWSQWAINPARDLGPKLAYMICHHVLRVKGNIYKDAHISFTWLPTIAPLCASVFCLINLI